MKYNIKRLGSLWLWGCIVMCLILSMLFRSMAGHGFLAFVFIGLCGLLFAFKLLELTAKHKWSVILRRVLIGCICLGLLIVVPTGVMIGCEATGDSETQCQYVIVLGAGVRGTTPSLSLRSRLDAAIEYLKERPDVICIVSGGQGEGEEITEAKCMFDELVKAGIDPERIWMEDRSTSTEENLRFSLDLIEERTGIRPAEINLLSNEYHLFRGKLFADKVGVTAYGVPAKSPYFTLFLNYYLREIAGVWHEILIGG